LSGRVQGELAGRHLDLSTSGAHLIKLKYERLLYLRTTGVLYINLSRFKFAGLPTPRDTEASNASAILHDSRGPVCICSLIGINSS